MRRDPRLRGVREPARLRLQPPLGDVRGGGEGGGSDRLVQSYRACSSGSFEAQATRHAKAGWLHDGGPTVADPYALQPTTAVEGQRRARGEMGVDYTPSVRDGTPALPMDAPPVERPGPTLYHPTTQTGATPVASPSPCPEEPQTYLLAPEPKEPAPDELAPASWAAAISAEDIAPRRSEKGARGGALPAPAGGGARADIGWLRNLE